MKKWECSEKFGLEKNYLPICATGLRQRNLDTPEILLLFQIGRESSIRNYLLFLVNS